MTLTNDGRFAHVPMRGEDSIAVVQLEINAQSVHRRVARVGQYLGIAGCSFSCGQRPAEVNLTLHLDEARVVHTTEGSVTGLVAVSDNVFAYWSFDQPQVTVQWYGKQIRIRDGLTRPVGVHVDVSREMSCNVSHETRAGRHNRYHPRDHGSPFSQ